MERGKSVSYKSRKLLTKSETEARETSFQYPEFKNKTADLKLEMLEEGEWIEYHVEVRSTDFFHKCPVIQFHQQERYSDSFKRIKIPLNSKSKIPSVAKVSDIRKLIGREKFTHTIEEVKKDSQRDQVMLIIEESPVILFRLNSRQDAQKFVAKIIYYTLFSEQAIVERMTKRLIYSFCRHEIFVYWIIHQQRKNWDIESLFELAKHLITVREYGESSHMDSTTRVHRAHKSISEYLRELPEYYDGTLTNQILKGKANPEVTLDLDRARGRISNAVIGIIGKEGLIPIEVAIETDKRREAHFSQKLRILGVDFYFQEGNIHIKKARPFTPEEIFPVRVFDVAPRITWVRDIQQVFFLGNGFSCRMTMESIAKKVYDHYKPVLPNFKKFSSLVAMHRVKNWRDPLESNVQDSFMKDAINTLILPLMPLDRPIQKMSYGQSKASLATLITNERYTLIGGYEVDQDEKIRIPKLEKICYPFGFFSDSMTADEISKLSGIRGSVKFPKRFHELRGSDFVERTSREFNYLIKKQGLFEELNRTQSNNEPTLEEIRVSSMNPRRLKLGPQGTFLDNTSNGRRTNGSRRDLFISEIRASSGDSDTFHDLKQVFLPRQELKEFDGQSAVQKPGQLPGTYEKNKISIKGGQGVFFDSTNSGAIENLVKELNREFLMKEFKEVELFYLDAKARFEINQVLKELILHPPSRQNASLNQAFQLLDLFLKLERLRMEFALDIYSFVQNVGHKEGVIMRESYFRRIMERKESGLKAQDIYEATKFQYGRYGYIVYKANTESELPTPRRSFLSNNRRDIGSQFQMEEDKDPKIMGGHFREFY